MASSQITAIWLMTLLGIDATEADGVANYISRLGDGRGLGWLDRVGVAAPIVTVHLCLGHGSNFFRALQVLFEKVHVTPLKRPLTPPGTFPAGLQCL
jgi:hypothetical protein